MSDPVLVAVTLLRDTLPNVRRFVEGNLCGGIDHLVVVLDGPAADVEAYLADHPQVTSVVADDEWWGDDRVASLNARQRVVANLVRAAAAEAGFVDWLFFVDGDEIALVDRSALTEVPVELDAVRLLPLESVAGGADLFKRLLTRPELRRLKALGLVEKANNARYFHGHVSGKVGVRPRADVRLGVHAAEGPDGTKVPAFEHPALRHLHLESPSLAEFDRKWTALAASGPPPGMRERRAAILQAFIALADEPDPTRREQAVGELYEAHVAEDVAGLEAAGVLERIDVRALTPTSTPIGPARRAALEAAIVRQEEKARTAFLPVRHGGAQPA